jgi:hypothetical protein
MRIIKENSSLKIEQDERFSLNGSKIGALRGGYFSVSEEELRRVIRKCQDIFLKSGLTKKEKGLFRADLVPFLKGEVEVSNQEIFLGELGVRGIYEINGKAPECTAAHEAYDFGEFSISPSAAQRLSHPLKKIGKIYFLRGNGAVKQQWGPLLFKRFKKYGVDIRMIDISELKKIKDGTLWIWGDFRPGSIYSEFTLKEERTLLDFLDSGIDFFNSLPNGVDITTKKQCSGFLLTQRNKERVLNDKNDWVLKPDDGASGKNIFFGKLENQKQWNKIVGQAANHNYVASRFLSLPVVNIPSLGKMVFDFNPAFWVENGKIEYLYTVVRLDSYERYKETLAINVARGGGFAGTIIDSFRGEY